MDLVFLTPLGALLAAGALLPLAALVVSERRARRARRVLGLDEPTLRSRVPTVAALSLVPALLGLALAQPVLRSSRTQHVRTDAQAFYILDTSRSMQASSAPGRPSRLARAVQAALRMRLALTDVPSGVATMTDRVLPDLFPTPSEQVFAATLLDAVGIDRPPPKGFGDRATTFAALDTLAGTNFFDEGIKHRLAIVFTDGETAPYFPSDLRAALRQKPLTSFVIVRFWHRNERIYRNDTPDPAYRPDPSSAPATRQLASVTSGHAFGEGSVGDAISAAKKMLGRGPIASLGSGLHVFALSRWLALAAIVPLAFLLWRRNVV